MKAIEINAKEGKVIINLPTSMEDITEQYLKDVTKHIVVAPEYSLIGIVYKTTLVEIINIAKVKETTVGVIPVFIKAGNTDNEFINTIDTKDVVVITGTNISLGIHVHVPTNNLSINNIRRVCGEDKTIMSNSFKDKDTYYCIEFKLIPNCNINGVLKSPCIIDSPYIAKVDTTNN